MLELLSENKNSISVSHMKDGDIAVIVDCSLVSNESRIVQRYKDSLINLGAASGEGWTDLFKYSGSCMRVHILEKGETLIVN